MRFIADRNIIREDITAYAPVFPDTELLKREMEAACDRKQYRHIVSHLHALKAYSSGQEAAKSLATYWYAYHKNRPAMKDELRRAGYVE